MKIKISKKQWERIGNKTGWIKSSGFPDKDDKEIIYKGKSITKKFPSGYYTFYSDKEQQFVTFDDLDAAKSHIDCEKKDDD